MADRIKPEYGWAAICLDGSPRPFIHINSAGGTRRQAMQYIINAWRREDETETQCWRRARRHGWRVQRVVVKLYGSGGQHAE
jgi:hypothetical protein